MKSLKQILRENNYQANLNDKTRALVKKWLQQKQTEVEYKKNYWYAIDWLLEELNQCQ